MLMWASDGRQVHDAACRAAQAMSTVDGWVIESMMGNSSDLHEEHCTFARVKPWSRGGALSRSALSASLFFLMRAAETLM